ncbi:GntR family transcriptional regulator [Cerasicoccus frondis]|uniref:GntR family transcriptional regulator n=1 Tax=Cerasicoccus frondis TaxID=490090 RepID=UPI0028524E4B|nr:GntR family transcriptional regulator [Cerasicoccus frondis]
MARTRSNRIKQIKSELIERLNYGFCRPGSRFISNRELATRLGVSYQTAHRLISELTDEGLLHRVQSSGTYVATSPPPQGVAFVFHPNTKKNNFGGILLSKIQDRFSQEDIPSEIAQGVVFDHYVNNRYNILWGQNYDVRRIDSNLNYSLMIDGEPEAGVNAAFTDSIEVNHFEVGRLCAKLMMERYGARRVLVLAGPHGNAHYAAQLAGFQTLYPRCVVIHQTDWAYWSAVDSIKDLSLHDFDGAFAVYDTAANALKTKFAARIPIVAYGDTDLLNQAEIDGVGIPWQGIVQKSLELYRARNEGNIGVGQRVVITPKPIIQLAESWNTAS